MSQDCPVKVMFDRLEFRRVQKKGDHLQPLFRGKLLALMLAIPVKGLVICMGVLIGHPKVQVQVFHVRPRLGFGRVQQSCAKPLGQRSSLVPGCPPGQHPYPYVLRLVQSIMPVGRFSEVLHLISQNYHVP